MDALKLHAFFLILLLPHAFSGAAAITDPVEVAALRAIQQSIGDTYQQLSNWVGNDPCESEWTGVHCVNVNGTNHVMELRLLNMNFTGTLAPDFGNLTYLTILDVMWNNITGSIPAEIGNLSNLYLLLLNGNKLTGTLPLELGNLSKLNRIQIDQNFISGNVPTTFQFLNQAKHFHMNNNSLNGSIPPELGRLESLVHLLLDNNNLSGELPPEISNISTLLIMQLDNNHFTGSIPSNYSNMPILTKLSFEELWLKWTSAISFKPNFVGLLISPNIVTHLRGIIARHMGIHYQLYPNLVLHVLSVKRFELQQIVCDLSFNQLDGELPAEFYSAPILEVL